MAMSFSILYEQEVVDIDIPALPKREKQRISNAIAEKLTSSPDTFGKPLRRSLRSYRALRVGDYRIIFRIEQKTVKIFAIGHRSMIYEAYMQRF